MTIEPVSGQAFNTAFVLFGVTPAKTPTKMRFCSIYRHKTPRFQSSCPDQKAKFRSNYKALFVANASRKGEFIRRGLAAGIITGTSIAIASVAGVMAASAAMTPQGLVQSGMKKFVDNDVEGSLIDFNRALELDSSIRPYLWQRGLSLYYVEQYAEGGKQFREDVAVNSSDTEEAIWAFLCEAKVQGISTARDSFLVVGRDPRPVMRAAYETFQKGLGSGVILSVAGSDTQGHAAFYAALYAGLYEEVEGMDGKARELITKAAQTEYALTSGDYMAALAKVHAARRQWPLL